MKNTNKFFLARKRHSTKDHRFRDYQQASSIIGVCASKFSKIENGKDYPDNILAAQLFKAYESFDLAKEYCSTCPVHKFLASREEE